MSASSQRVSVVVPCFNHARHIAEALQSVANQDYEDLELIVIDDASSDESAETARKILENPAFRERFADRVQLSVNRENIGAHATLNRGLALASGELLAILNSDDRYLPGRLRQLVTAMQERGSKLAFSGVEYIDDASQPLESPRSDAFRLRRHQAGIDRFPSVGFACMCSNVAITSGNLVFSRELLEAVGGFDDLRYCHDWDFLLRAVALVEPVFVRRALYGYRLHQNNTFRRLADAAEEETRVVLTRYFETVRGGRVRNPLAPSDINWPGVFEYVMTRQGFWRYW